MIWYFSYKNLISAFYIRFNTRGKHFEVLCFKETNLGTEDVAQ